ncbi:hypothetical protein ACFX13_045410 [Malus domestica]
MGMGWHTLESIFQHGREKKQKDFKCYNDCKYDKRGGNNVWIPFRVYEEHARHKESRIMTKQTSATTHVGIYSKELLSSSSAIAWSHQNEQSTNKDCRGESSSSAIAWSHQNEQSTNKDCRGEHLRLGRK